MHLKCIYIEFKIRLSLKAFHFWHIMNSKCLLKEIINAEITRFLLLPHTKMKILTCCYDYRVPNLAHGFKTAKRKPIIFPDESKTEESSSNTISTHFSLIVGWRIFNNELNAKPQHAIIFFQLFNLFTSVKVSWKHAKRNFPHLQKVSSNILGMNPNIPTLFTITVNIHIFKSLSAKKNSKLVAFTHHRWACRHPAQATFTRRT